MITALPAVVVHTPGLVKDNAATIVRDMRTLQRNGKPRFV